MNKLVLLGKDTSIYFVLHLIRAFEICFYIKSLNLHTFSQTEYEQTSQNHLDSTTPFYSEHTIENSKTETQTVAYYYNTSTTGLQMLISASLIYLFACFYDLYTQHYKVTPKQTDVSESCQNQATSKRNINTLSHISLHLLLQSCTIAV